MESKAKFLINSAYITVWGIIIFLSARFLYAYLLPFAFAVIIAMVSRKLAKRLERKIKMREDTLSLIWVFILFAALLFIIGITLFFLIRFAGAFSGRIPQIADNIIEIADNFTKRLQGTSSRLYDLLGGVIGDFKVSVKEIFSQKATGIAGNIALKIPDLLFSFLITIIASCYFAKDYNRLTAFLKDILPKKTFKNVIKIKGILFNNIPKIALGYLMLCSIVFAVVFVLFLVLRIDNAFLLSFIIAIVDLLPVLGAGTILLPWAVISFIMGKTMLGIKLLAVYGVLLVLRNFAEPKIISRQTGIDPLLTLIAMFVGLRLLGLLGLIIFPLILVVVFAFYRT